MSKFSWFGCARKGFLRQSRRSVSNQGTESQQCWLGSAGALRTFHGANSTLFTRGVPLTFVSAMLATTFESAKPFKEEIQERNRPCRRRVSVTLGGNYFACSSSTAAM